MFTIEHDFDATVITLVDEGKGYLREDGVISAFDDCVVVEQFDERLNRNQRVELSLTQIRDLFAAIDLPEGVYRLRQPKGTDQSS